MTQTKLTPQALIDICITNGKEPNEQNMALAAFLNDPDFRKQVTDHYFQCSLRSVETKGS